MDEKIKLISGHKNIENLGIYHDLNLSDVEKEYWDAADTLLSLRMLPSNRLEALGGNRKGQHSIRINNQYRICFEWEDAGPKNVEIVDYH